MRIESQRRGDLVTEVRAHRLATGAANHLAHQPSVGNRMIAVPGARLPPWLLLGESRAHRIPVVERLGCELLAHRGQTGPMAQQESHRQLFFSRLRKLGPVARNRSVKIELALIDQPMRADRGQPLGARVNVNQRVARPWPRARLIRVTAPQIDERRTVEGYGNRRADFASALEVLREHRAHAPEFFCATSLDLRSHRPVSCRCFL